MHEAPERAPSDGPNALRLDLLGFGKRRSHILGQPRLVGFDGQHVIHAPGHNLFGSQDAIALA